ncbi:hypothetical protein KKE60_04485 [Patescibacteria group bacterium]|nr:hypothetical protein [Patescibacteria group bacterium]
MRLWLIEKLAGKRMIVLNAHINPWAAWAWESDGTPETAVISPRYDEPEGLIMNCVFHSAVGIVNEEAGA